MREKPGKPFKDYPLTVHPNGQYSKKIRGSVHYFGAWDDPMKALERYYQSKAYLESGLAPPPNVGTVGELAAAYQRDIDGALDRGELEASTHQWYSRVVVCVDKALGKRPINSLTYADFRSLRTIIAKGISPATLKRRLTVARMLFRFGKKLGIQIETHDALKAPAAKLLRQANHVRLFTPKQIRWMIEHGGELTPYVLLGINCAFGMHDVLRLKSTHIDGEWATFPRPKTGVQRRCWLWPETVKALPDREGLLFPAWDRHILWKEFRLLVDDFYVKDVTTHYTLRRTFETIAINGASQSVVDAVMGHADHSMAGVYRQKSFDSKIKECCSFVRDWTYGRVDLS